MLSALFTLALGAQINDGSTIPVNVSITAPADIAGPVTYNSTAAAWGGNVTQGFSGEVAWGFNMTDSLGCAVDGPILTDLTGKIALIRRGVCAFVEKGLAAQEAGAIAFIVVNDFRDGMDDEATIVMGGDDNGTTIPGIFLSAATSVLIAGAIDAGETVTLEYEVGQFATPATAWAYNQPLNNIEPYPFSVSFYNSGTEELIVDITATIIAPDGTEEFETLTDTFPAVTADTVVFTDFYTPTQVGLHTVRFSSDASAESMDAFFNVTDFTYNAAQLLDVSTGAGLGPADELYLNSGIYQAATLVVTGDDGGIATHASFGLANPELFFDEDDGGEVFALLLYDADADDDGAVDLANNFSDMDNGIIAVGEYMTTGMEVANEELFVTFEDPIELEANKVYYISILKTPEEGSGNTPRFTGSSDLNAAPNYIIDGGTWFTTPLELDQLYTGWNGASVAVGLHLDGFMLPSDVRDLPTLAASQVQIAPNPVASQLNLTLSLEGVVNNVQIGIAGVDGRRHGLYTFDAVTNAPLNINVSELAAGTYFVSILTDQGYRTEKFVKQ